MLPLHVLFVCVTTATIVGVFALMVVVYRFRRDKAVKAGSPSLTYLLLIGAIILYSEFLVTSFPCCNRVTCMIRPWVRHIGFFTFYGALLFKTWRVSVVMCAFKSSTFRTKDSELVKMVAIAMATCALFMSLWTVVDPGGCDRTLDVRRTCRLQWWEVVAVTAEWAFLLWGAVVCYHSRKAPDLYNESVQIGFVIWNESLWCLFYVFARVTLARHPDADMQLYLHFLRAECSVTSNLLLLFLPKMLHLFRNGHILHGTLTDVHGVRQVHRVSLRVGRAGDVQSIYCVPCGPLALADDDSAATGEGPETVEEARRYVREDEYSKAEVDALIDMVSRLKTEKEMYKTETRRLWQAMRDCGLGGGSLTSSAVSPVEEDIVLGAPLRRPRLPSGPRLGGRSRASVQPAPPSYLVGSESTTDPLGGMSMPSPERCRRASTVSSYLSSSRSSVADVSSTDDLLGGSVLESQLDAGVKLPLLDGFGGLRVTDVDGERVDNTACNIGGCFTDNNGNCSHQEALVATVYDALTSPGGAINYADCHVLGPWHYARCGLAASRRNHPRVCSKVNFIMHI